MLSILKVGNEPSKSRLQNVQKLCRERPYIILCKIWPNIGPKSVMCKNGAGTLVAMIRATVCDRVAEKLVLQHLDCFPSPFYLMQQNVAEA